MRVIKIAQNNNARKANNVKRNSTKDSKYQVIKIRIPN